MGKLFKRDTKGRIRFLEIKTDGSELIQISGVMGTENPITHSRICVGKNIGRSNETTAEEQAELEKKSIARDKLTKGYFISEKEAKEEEVISPMLADTYEKHIKKIDWTKCFVQPKLDGMRCLAIIKDGNVTLKSRDGKIIANMTHIEEELKGLRDMILDGELYKHGDSFQENMKLIKKYRKGKTEDIKFHVYDMVSDESFATRILISGVEIEELEHSVSVFTRPVESEEGIKSMHIVNINNGYEGSIIRYGDKPYEVNKRSNSLLKYKDFSDMDLAIVDIVASDKRPTHGKPIFEIDGQQFSSGTKMSFEDREDLLANKEEYIGKIANLRFFELSDTGIPRFPVMCGIHGDRDK